MPSFRERAKHLSLILIAAVVAYIVATIAYNVFGFMPEVLRVGCASGLGAAALGAICLWPVLRRKT